MTCASKKEDELVDHNNYELFFSRLHNWIAISTDDVTLIDCLFIIKGGLPSGLPIHISTDSPEQSIRQWVEQQDLLQ